MSQKNRLQSGGRINRDQPMSFVYNGKNLQGFEGDTLASALLANGIDVVGRVLNTVVRAALWPRALKSQMQSCSWAHRSNPGAKRSSDSAGAVRQARIRRSQWLAQR